MTLHLGLKCMLYALAALLLHGCGPHNKCGSNKDCVGARTCVEGVCVDPFAQAGSSGNSLASSSTSSSGASSGASGSRVSGPSRSGSSRPSGSSLSLGTSSTSASLGGPCRENAECGPNLGIAGCQAPGEWWGCGYRGREGVPCQQDSECRPDGGGNPASGLGVGTFVNGVCGGATHDCSLTMDTPICLPPCTSTSCGEGQWCNPDTWRCGPQVCDVGSPCPEHFQCTPAGACGRKLCTLDNQCAGGACVKGQCYSMPGVCALYPI